MSLASLIRSAKCLSRKRHSLEWQNCLNSAVCYLVRDCPNVNGATLVRIATAFAAKPNTPRRPNAAADLTQQFWAAVHAHSHRGLVHDEPPDQQVRLLWAASLSEQSSDLIVAQVCARLPVAQLQPRSLSNLLWTLARLPSPAASTTPIISQVCDAILACPPASLADIDVVNSVWALATLKFRHEPTFAFLGDICRLRRLSLQQVSRVMWSFASAGIEHKQLFEAVQNQIDSGKLRPPPSSSNPKALADLMWSITTLRLHLPSALTALISERTIAEASPHALASIAWSIAASSSIDDDAEAVSAIFEWIGRISSTQIQTWRSNMCMATLLWSFTTMGYLHVPLFSAASECLSQQAGRRWDTFRAKDLVMTVHALVNTEEFPHRRSALQSGAQAALSILPSFKPGELASLSWLFTKCTPSVAQDIDPRFFHTAAALLERDWAKLSAGELATAIAALGAAKSASLQRATLRNLAQFEPRNIAMLLRALSQSPESADPELVKALKETVLSSHLQEVWWAADLADAMLGLVRCSGICPLNETEMDTLVSAFHGQENVAGVGACVNAAKAMDEFRWDSSRRFWRLSRRISSVQLEIRPHELAEFVFAAASSSLLNKASIDAYLRRAFETSRTQLCTSSLVKVTWSLLSSTLSMPMLLFEELLSRQDLADLQEDPGDVWRFHELQLHHRLQQNLELCQIVCLTEPPSSDALAVDEVTEGWKTEMMSAITSRLSTGSCRVEVVCPLSGYRIDIAIPNHSKLAILLEPNTSFGRRHQRPRAALALKKEILTLLGYKVAVVPQFKHDRSTTGEDEYHDDPLPALLENVVHSH